MTMTHLKIIQNNNVIEEVTSSLITKLYDIAHAGLDSSSDLQGRLHTTGAYGNEVQWLTQHYQDLYITSDKLYIKFQDPNAQQWCVSNFSLDGVGCSQTDLSSVTNSQFDGTSFRNSSIVNFDEFRYFTSITQVNVSNNIAEANSTLKTITLPDSVTRIGQYGAYGGGFFGYSALESIRIPANCTIGQAAFRLCTSLKSVSFGNNVIIGSNSFYQCASLINVNLTGVTTIEDSAFSECTALTSINIPTSVTNIKTQFCSSSGVTSITFDEGGTDPLVIEGNTSGWKPGTFRMLGSQKIVFPERLSELKNNALGCTSAMTYVFTSTTPPSVTGNGQITTDITNSKIYVPDAAVNNYKAATGFDAYAQYIYPVSELPS